MWIIHCVASRSHRCSIMLLFKGATMEGNGLNTRSMSKFRTNVDTSTLARPRVSLACCYIFYVEPHLGPFSQNPDN